MRAGKTMGITILLSLGLLCGCGGASSGSGTTTGPSPAAAPSFTTTAALGGAQVVSLASATSGATIYYTIDGSTPTASSIQYIAPFLVASNITVNAIATAPGMSASSVASKSFAANIASGTLVWSDEFANSGATQAQPNAHAGPTTPATAASATTSWRTTAHGVPHLTMQSVEPERLSSARTGTCTSWRSSLRRAYTLQRGSRSQGLFSFQYGRIEARMMVPESQGMWPAFWLLGNNIDTINWPACGELDIMEHIDAQQSD